VQGNGERSINGCRVTVEQELRSSGVQLCNGVAKDNGNILYASKKSGKKDFKISPQRGKERLRGQTELFNLI
jgi:hypothetical protein